MTFSVTCYLLKCFLGTAPLAIEVNRQLSAFTNIRSNAGVRVTFMVELVLWVAIILPVTTVASPHADIYATL